MSSPRKSETPAQSILSCATFVEPRTVDSVIVNKDSAGDSTSVEKYSAGDSAIVDKYTSGDSAIVDKDSTGDSVSVDKDSTGDSAIVEKDCTGYSTIVDKDSTGDSASVDKDSTGDSAIVDRDSIGDSAGADKDLLQSLASNGKDSVCIHAKAKKKSKKSAVKKESNKSSSTIENERKTFAKEDADNAYAPAADVEPLMEKHLLNSCWTLWFYKSDRGRAWTDSQLAVASFNSVEDFWRLTRYAMPPSRLPPGCDYSVFKAGCPPMWEAPDNREGGRWIARLDRRPAVSASVATGPAETIDVAWTEVLLLAIGESFSDRVGRHISGFVVQIRPRHYRLCLWTRQAADQSACMAAGRLFRAALQRCYGAADCPSLAYEAHSELQRFSATRRAAFASCRGGSAGFVSRKPKQIYYL